MQQEERVSEVMGRVWDVLLAGERDGAGEKPGIRCFIPAWDAKAGSRSVAGSQEMDCMGTVGVLPKPSEYLCLKITWSCRKMGWRRGILLPSFQAPPKGGVLKQADEIEALFTLRLELESL